MNRFMRQSRLLQPAEFRAVFNGNPVTVSDDNFRLLAIPRTQSGNNSGGIQRQAVGSRLGLAIAKKNIRSASQRNCIKRQAREAFRNFPALQQAKLCSIDELACGRSAAAETTAVAPLDIVVLARSAAANADKSSLRQSLQQLLQQLMAKQNSLR